MSILEIINAKKARKVALHHQTSAPVPSPNTVPGGKSIQECEAKDKLYSLECQKLSGAMSDAEYEETKAKLMASLQPIPGAVSEPSAPGAHINERQQLNTAQRVCIAVTMAIPLVFRAWFLDRTGYSFTNYPAVALGAWIGDMIIPFLVSYAVAGVRRRRSWVRFSSTFLLTGILIPFLGASKSLTSLSKADLMKELVGVKPLESGLPPNQVEMAAATRELTAQMVAFSKEQDGKLPVIEKGLETLYAPSSFSSKEAIQRSLDAVDARLAWDKENVQMFDRMPDMAQDQINRTSLSNAEKADFMMGIKNSRSSSGYLFAYKKMLSAEENWADSTKDLYSYALLHKYQILTDADQIGINSDAIREQFNARFAHAQKMRDDFLAAAKKASDIRQENERKLGVSQKDLGFTN